MSSQLYNNVTDSISNPVESADTTITVSDGSKFTDPGDGNYTPLYLIRASDGAHEIVYITSVSGNDLEVTRSEEGTDPLVFNTGDTVQVRPTRQSLLDMDGSVKTSTGAQRISEALDRRVIYVDTIADLQALDTSELADGQQVQVREYHAGTGVGGGDFYYDPARGAESDGGIVLSGFVRIPSAYIDAHAFGGDSYTGDCFTAIQMMIDHVLDHGTVSTAGWTGLKIIDGRFTVNKPCRVLSSDSVSFKLADQSDLFHSTSGGASNRTEIIRVASGDVEVSGFSIDCNKLGNYVESEGVRYYFLESPSSLGLDASFFRYLSAIVVSGPDGSISNVTISNNSLTNCSVHGIGVAGEVGLEHGIPDLASENLYARNVRIFGNYLSGGCRSALYFISGVVNSEMYGNTVEDWSWTALRVYYSTNNCKILNNRVISNKDINPADFEKSTPDLSGEGSIALGAIRVGHGTRSPGTCDNTEVDGNYIYLYGARDLTVNTIAVEGDIKTVKISNNRIIDDSAPSTATDIVTNSIIRVFCPDKLIFAGNTIRSSCDAFFSLYSTTESEKSVDISRNFIEYTGTVPVTGISVRQSVALSGVDLPIDLRICGNKFIGMVVNSSSSTAISYTGRYRTFRVTGNELTDCSTTESRGDIIRINSSSSAVISDNFISLAPGHGMYLYGVVLNNTDFGIVQNNVLEKDNVSLNAWNIPVSVTDFNNQIIARP